MDCDQNCHDKENRVCLTEHAEIIAIRKLSTTPLPTHCYAFVNLFPCAPCQKALKKINIQEIVVAGPKHKEQVVDNIRLEADLYKNLLLENGIEKQLSVAQGELAELITAVSDYFYREDKHEPIENLLDEIIDVELMLMQLKMICWKKDPHTYNKLRLIRSDKHVELNDRIVKKML